MHGLALHVGAELGAERLVCHEVDGAAEQVFKVELHALVRLRRCRPVEPDEDIDIARARGVVTRERAEQCQAGHAEPLGKRFPVLPERIDDLVAVHGVHCTRWGGAFPTPALRRARRASWQIRPSCRARLYLHSTCALHRASGHTSTKSCRPSPRSPCQCSWRPWTSTTQRGDAF